MAHFATLRPLRGLLAAAALTLGLSAQADDHRIQHSLMGSDFPIACASKWRH